MRYSRVTAGDSGVCSEGLDAKSEDWPCKFTILTTPKCKFQEEFSEVRVASRLHRPLTKPPYKVNCKFVNCMFVNVKVPKRFCFKFKVRGDCFLAFACRLNSYSER